MVSEAFLVEVLESLRTRIINKYSSRMGRMKRREGADDLYQIVCLNALKFRHQCQSTDYDGVARWVYGIARHKFHTIWSKGLSVKRSINREIYEDADRPFQPLCDENPAEIAAQRDEIEFALSMMETFPERQVTAVKLLGSGIPASQAAREMGVSKDSFDGLLRRARTAIQNLLAKRSVVSAA